MGRMSAGAIDVAFWASLKKLPVKSPMLDPTEAAPIRMKAK